MEMLDHDHITQANLTGWRKLGQGLHARLLVGDFTAGARFVSAIAEAGDTVGHHLRVNVWVAPEAADQRIAAAVAAGGTIVDDSHAPSYTVIADQDGNKACVCTSLSRA